MTAEIAVLLPALFAVVAAGMAAVAVVGAQLRCIDAAREAARAAARGEPAASAQRIASEVGPDGASVAVSYAGDRVTVLVSADIRLTRLLPTITVDAHAVGRLEPGLPAAEGAALGVRHRGGHE